MNLIKTLFIGIASLLLVSCSTIKTSSTISPNEDWLVVCPKVVAVAPTTFGETQQQLIDLFDLYTECRVHHNAWVQYERKKK